MEYKKINKTTMGFMGKMMEADADKMKAFQQFMGAVEGGKLDGKVKELILLAIAIKAQCKYCIAWHVERAVAAGATKEEMVEVIWLATLMGGGPALMYGQEAMEAIEEYLK